MDSFFAPILEQLWVDYLRKSSSEFGANQMNVIGPQVRQLREQQKLTQVELAARCNLAGWNISRGTLAKIEAKVRRVTDDEVALLAKALKVDIERLFEES